MGSKSCSSLSIWPLVIYCEGVRIRKKEGEGRGEGEKIGKERWERREWGVGEGSCVSKVNMVQKIVFYISLSLDTDSYTSHRRCPAGTVAHAIFCGMK